jgi:hypothetical protein
MTRTISTDGLRRHTGERVVYAGVGGTLGFNGSIPYFEGDDGGIQNLFPGDEVDIGDVTYRVIERSARPRAAVSTTTETEQLALI